VFIPYSDDNETERAAVVNYLLIAVNVFIYSTVNFQPDAWEAIKPYALYPDNVTMFGLFGCMFFHASFLHLLGNMLLLHIYGDNIEDKFGHFGYLLFYVGAGVVAGLFHVATGTKPCIGASGAVAGVMGAYVVIYPLAKIRFLFVFIPLFKKVEIYSWVVLTFWFAGQLLDHFGETEAGVAFAAHIGGFIFGSIVSGLLVLADKIEPEKSREAKRLSHRPARYEPPQEKVEIDLEERFIEEKKNGVPCPSCVKAMPFTEYRGVQLENCFECGGLWLDRGETETLLRDPHLPYSLLNPPARNPHSILVPEGERKCARCETLLQTVEIEGVQVEGCPSCGGLWLERGRLGDLKARLG